MRKIKTFESFEKKTSELSKEYLFETCNIQEVLDMLLRVAYEIYENPKNDIEEVEDGQILLIVNINFGGGNQASIQFDQDILKKMSVGIDDLSWQFYEPVDNEFFERNHNEAKAKLINDIRERQLELTDTGALVAVIDWESATQESLQRDLAGFNLKYNVIPNMLRRYSINKRGLVMVGVNWGELEGIEQNVHDFMRICNEFGEVKGPWGPLMYCMEDPNQDAAKLSGREGSTGKYEQDFVFVAPRDGDIKMSMDIGVIYNVGSWDPTILVADTANAYGLISENLPEWNIDTVNSWDL